ncbi:MAG: nucleotidyltransferase family protein [Caldiserica bacterium]|nr:nucleotidyltransferase family protein [Caldisericota bacterium]
MIALLLNAGYGTRLYPLTLNFPKGLLKIGERSICDYLVDKLKEINVDEIYLITNARFYPAFKKWGEENRIHVLNDETDGPENRLGAIRDIQFFLERVNPSDDVLILSGDNLFDFSLKSLYEAFQEHGGKHFTVGLFRMEEEERIKSYGVVELGENGRVVKFQEKPEEPFSDLASIGIYIYPKGKLFRVSEYLSKGNNPDAPGFFLEWLIKVEEVYSCIFSGNWYDIGTLETLEEARECFAGK